VVFSNEVCSTFTAMSSRTSLSDIVCTNSGTSNKMLRIASPDKCDKGSCIAHDKRKSKISFFIFCYIISYGTVFWRNSPGTRKLFYIKRNIIRIMAGSKRRVSCRELFRKFLQCQWILMLGGHLLTTQKNFRQSEIYMTSL